MSDTALLDNVIWHTLVGPHTGYAVGRGDSRAYGPGFSPLVGFADATRPDFDALASVCTPGERYFTDDWSGPVPAGWSIELESTMFKMVWAGQVPPEGRDAAGPAVVALRPQHAAQAFDLAMLTRPGPFGPRTPELGEYFGCFDGERLIAMAGERLHAGRLREISGVCTHPDHQGRGLARRLMNVLIRRETARGETPFLHVMRANETAHGLYRRMGFSDYRETVVRAIVRR